LLLLLLVITHLACWFVFKDKAEILFCMRHCSFVWSKYCILSFSFLV